MNVDTIQEELAAFFRERGVAATASWPKEARKAAAGPEVLVSLEKMACEPAALQNYLGQGFDAESGQERELYARRTQMTFTLDILAPPRTGAQACRTVFDQLLRILQNERPLSLSVRELESEEMSYNEKEDLLRLRCHLGCTGWLYAAGDEAGTFLNFILRGDVKT